VKKKKSQTPKTTIAINEKKSNMMTPSVHVALSFQFISVLSRVLGESLSLSDFLYFYFLPVNDNLWRLRSRVLYIGEE